MFKLKKKSSPSDLVRTSLACIQTIDDGKNDMDSDDVNKAREKISQSLHEIRFLLYGDNEQDPKPDNIEKVVVEVLENDVLIRLVQSMEAFQFEARKDVEKIFNFLIRRGAQNGTLAYIRSHLELLELLVAGYDKEIALNCGSVLRECIRHEEICQIILEAPYFYNFFDYVQRPSFDVAADAFATLKLLLTKHKTLAADYLLTNYDEFFGEYNKLVQSKNYVTKRQSLKLLGEILLDRKNFNIMIRYINDAENLKLMMILLRGKSKNIQFEAFHVFKVFVANPEKSQPVLDILVRNRSKLIAFLQEFQTDKDDDEQFVEEKNILLATLSRLEK